MPLVEGKPAGSLLPDRLACAVTLQGPEFSDELAAAEEQFGPPKGQPGQWAGCLRIVDPASLSTVFVTEMDNNEVRRASPWAAATPPHPLPARVPTRDRTPRKDPPACGLPRSPHRRFSQRVRACSCDALGLCLLRCRSHLEVSPAPSPARQAIVSMALADLAMPSTRPGAAAPTEKLLVVGCAKGLRYMPTDCEGACGPEALSGPPVSWAEAPGASFLPRKGVGAAHGPRVPSAPAAAYVRVYRLADEGRRLELLHKTPVEGGVPGCLCGHKGRLLAGVGPTLRLYELGKKKLLRKCEYNRCAYCSGG